VADAAPMMKRLLRQAVAQYMASLEFAREVDREMPEAFKPPWNPAAEPAGARQLWWLLHAEADAQFEAAESALADRINNGFDAVAAEGNRVGPTEDYAEFVERAIKVDGTLFVLVFDAGEYEPGRNIIAIVGADRVASLDD
jgi:hypothetical protein